MTPLQSLLEAHKLTTLLTIVVAVLFSTTGELLLKAGMNRVGAFAITPPHLLRAFTNPLILLGFGLFGIGAVVWLLVLSRADLSFAYPMLAMGYLLVVIESRLFLGEAVTPQRWLGVLVIVAGMVILYGTPAETP